MKHPKISDAEKLSQQFAVDGVLVVCLANGGFSVTSYGSDKRQCAQLRKLNEFITDAMADGRIDLSAFEEGCPWPRSTQGSEYDV